METASEGREAATERTGATVVAIFGERADAERAVTELVEAGFREEQLGAAILDERERESFGEATGTQTDAAASGAAKGALSGGVVGGLIGLLGSLLIPGVGPIVAGGVLASVLTGAAAGAAAGGLIGVLVGLGASEEEARYFDERFRAGGILITVEATGRVAEARAILESHNGDLGPVHRRDAAGRAATDGRTLDSEPADMEMRTGGDGLTQVPIDHDVATYAAWSGAERRVWSDPAYAGPERRLAAR